MQIKNPNRHGGRLRKLMSRKWKRKWGIESWCNICCKTGAAEPLSKAELRERREKVSELRENAQRRMRAYLAGNQDRGQSEFIPPRYDDVYAEGLLWLERLAGPPPEPDETIAEFSDDEITEILDGCRSYGETKKAILYVPAPYTRDVSKL